LWIFSWAVVGATLCGRWRLFPSFLSILLAASAIAGSLFLAFLNGWWLPLVPALLTLFGSAGVITAYVAHLQEEFKRSKEFLQGVIDNIPDPIFVKNKENRWIVLNQAYCQLIGHPLETLIEKSDYDFFSKAEADTFREHDEIVFGSGIAIEHEEEFTDAEGILHLIATKRSLHKDGAGNLFLVGVIRDITERKRVEEDLKRTTADLVRSNTELKLSEKRLQYIAHHDPLTGLPNRQLFVEHLNQSLSWAQSHQVLVGLLFIDLDGFKQVNDTLGHDYGDRLLIAVAQRLAGCLRHSDIVSRLGGDEFTVILPAILEVKVAVKVAKKILATLSEVFVLEEQRVLITASIGISVYPLHSDSQESLIKQADIAMYQAKQLGKNCYIISS
jgi:diguanylate cyclase (GGDEF)-like protein/PAS domain S-box-containing protein